MKSKRMQRTFQAIHRLNNQNRDHQPSYHRDEWEPPTHTRLHKSAHDHFEEHIGELIVGQW